MVLLEQASSEESFPLLALVVLFLGSGALSVFWSWLKSSRLVSEQIKSSAWFDNLDAYVSLALHAAERWADEEEEIRHGKRPSSQDIRKRALDALQATISESDAPENFKSLELLSQAIEAKLTGGSIRDYDPDKQSEKQSGKLLG